MYVKVTRTEWVVLSVLVKSGTKAVFMVRAYTAHLQVA